MGNTYELTPLAERVAAHTAQALGSADRVFQTRPAFEPAHALREFTLVVTDIHLATFGRTLAALVRDAAPGVRLRFQHIAPQIARRAQEHLRTVDGMVLPQGRATGGQPVGPADIALNPGARGDRHASPDRTGPVGTWPAR
ncbi:hypothetical protein [Streptomyces vastus]|uniref:hypothetical protein n=1 Tax=Streptomyces vastus TaxID=285451 RepID=UPI0031E23326